MQPVKPIFGSFIIFVFLLHCLLPLIRSIGNRVSHIEGGMGHPPPSEKQPPPPPPLKHETPFHEMIPKKVQ